MKGFTLIETLIYIAIIGTAISSFVVFSISIGNSRNKSYVIQEVHGNARVALDLISQRIRNASSVNISASTFDIDPGVLSLAMVDSTKNQTLINLTGNDGTLQITEGVSSALPIVSDEVKITNLIFTNLTASSAREHIRIQMTVEYAKSDDVYYTYAKSFQTAESLRQ
jgi:type II secretory pathway pseudopilin PulG